MLDAVTQVRVTALRGRIRLDHKGDNHASVTESSTKVAALPDALEPLTMRPRDDGESPTLADGTGAMEYPFAHAYEESEFDGGRMQSGDTDIGSTQAEVSRAGR